MAYIPDYVIRSALDAQSGQAGGYMDPATGEFFAYPAGYTPPAPRAPVPAPAPAPMGPPPPPAPGLDSGMQAAVQAAFGQQAPPVMGPPAAIPPEVVAAAQQAAPDPPAPAPSPVMASVLESALRGSQRTVPGGFRQTANQLEQDTAAPLPGADIKRQGPAIETGVPDIDVATFRALTPQQQAEYLGRLGSQETKPLRIGPEPIDMDLFDALTPEQQAEYQRRLDSQTSTISTGPAGYKKTKVGKGKNARTVTVPVNQQFDPSGAPVQSESPYSRATSELGLAEDRARLGAEQSLEDTAEGYDQQSRAYAMHQYQADARVQKYEQDQAARRAFIESELPRLEKYLDERSKQQAVNPVASYNESKGFGGRLINAIAIGLSTLGSGLNGAPNIAWEMIQKEIDGEVLKQRQITENLGQQFMVRRQLYADMLGQFMTPAEAEAATRYALETSALNELRKIQARSQSEEAKNAASMVGTLLEQDRAKQKKASLEGRARRLWQDVPARTVGKPGGIKGLVDTLDLMQVPKKDQFQIINAIVNKGTVGGAEKMNEIGTAKPARSRDEMREIQYEGETSVPVPDRFASFLGTKNLRAVDHADAVKKREVLNDGDRLLETYDRLGKLVETGSALSPTQRAEVEQISATAMGSWRTLLGLGVLSESDKELLVPISGIFANDLLTLRDKKKMVDNLRSLVFRTIKTVGQTASRGEGQFNPAVKPIVARDVK